MTELEMLLAKLSQFSLHLAELPEELKLLVQDFFNILPDEDMITDTTYASELVIISFKGFDQILGNLNKIARQQWKLL